MLAGLSDYDFGGLVEYDFADGFVGFADDLFVTGFTDWLGSPINTCFDTGSTGVGIVGLFSDGRFIRIRLARFPLVFDWFDMFFFQGDGREVGSWPAKNVEELGDDFDIIDVNALRRRQLERLVAVIEHRCRLPLRVADRQADLMVVAGLREGQVHLLAPGL